MNKTLNTSIKELTLSKKIEKFWNEEIISKYTSQGSYSSFSERNKPPFWDKIENTNIEDLLVYITDFYIGEYYEFNEEKQNSSSYKAIQFLNGLQKENVPIRNLLETQCENPPGLLSHRGLLNMYIEFLYTNKLLIEDNVLEKILSKLSDEKRYMRDNDLEEQVDLYFSLLNVVSPSKITEDWFIKNLDVSCLQRDYLTKEIIDGSHNLNYNSQQKIFKYISNNFAHNLEKHTKYYKDLLDNNPFEMTTLFQGTLKINVFKLLKEYKLEQSSSEKLIDIAGECLNVVTSQEFMKLINQDIQVYNIHSKKTQSHIQLNFSTATENEMKEFQSILLLSLKKVLEAHEQISVEWFESYHTSESEISTNMNAKFISQLYLYSKLNENLEENKVGIRKNKI